jgi:ubiquinone/menaquinone biosynthesis C-methylase UbiE
MADKPDGAVYWDELAPRYDRFMKHVRRGYRVLVRRMLAAVAADSEVVELAAGTGHISLALAPAVKSVVGVDLSEEMVARARAKAVAASLANAQFRVADARNTGLPAGSADAVVACNALHVVPHPERLLREMRRIARPHGLLIVASYCHGQNAITRIVSRLMSLQGFCAASKWSVDGLAEFLAGCGLRIEHRLVVRGLIPLLYVEARPS